MAARPFVKMAGGKTKLLPEILKRVPVSFRHYHEPFVGGGACFWELARLGRLDGQVVACLSDNNPLLVDAYQTLQENAAGVIARLEEMPYDKEFFLATRARDPHAMSPLERTAWLIYLNKTAFNGLWRVNKSGVFNVPFGKPSKEGSVPLICDAANLYACGTELRRVRVELRHGDFAETLEHVRKDDFVYVDPPYIPISKTSDFTSYTADRFTLDDHERLRDCLLTLKARGAHVLHSNSSAPEVLELYERPEFKVEKVMAARSVSADGAKRGAVAEVLVS